jgi:amino acid adenylation domain-containing protein
MESERNLVHTILTEWNNTYAPYSSEKCIHQLFEDRTVLDSERIALVFDGGELTYSDLNEKADCLAVVLQSYKIGTGDFVGLLLKRSPELIICLLAILKAGAAYVPLTLSDPINRTRSIIESAGIKFVITNTGHEIDLKGNFERLNIEQVIKQSGDFRVASKNIVIRSTDPAYIIFTSGTTGTPKGVLVSHKSVINVIEWVNKTFGISHSDKLLWITSLSFDLSVYDIFGILAAGGIIRIVSDKDCQDPDKQYDLLLNEGITFWDSAPQSLQQLTPPFESKGNPCLYNSLRLVFLSGDWIPLSLPIAVTSFFPSAVVVGLGGATEATIWSNYFIINKIQPEWKSIPYGKPIQNTRYYILDDNLDHVGIRQSGNLYIGGDCLALGYYNDPVLTNSKFIADPFNPGYKLYLTGDKAQWLADGNIEFLGREDEQIKIRGYRIEMGEIKNAALENKAIKEAIVLSDKSDRHDIKVILFITTYDNRKLEVKDLKRELRGRLPDYMIPTSIIQYDEFPATINGKIDTKALFSDYVKSLNDNMLKNIKIKPGKDLHFVTPVYEIIYNIWSEALKMKDISLTDNFFEIGGNSLLAISVFLKIKSAFNVELDLKVFFASPRILDLGEVIEITKQKMVDNKPDEFSNIMHFNIGGNKTPVFLVHLDNGNYIISDHLGPDQPVYGFFHPGSEGEAIRYQNVNQMAKAYLDNVLALNPAGPFYLIGFSFGGVLAFEMAVQLQKAGHEVPFLVLIDSLSPLAWKPIKWQSNFFKIMRKNILGPLRRWLEREIKLIICKSYILTKNPIPIKQRKFYIYQKYKKLTKRYKPNKFNGGILLFRANDNNSFFKYLGWETLVENVKMISLEANHTTIFDNKKSVEILQTEIKENLIHLINNK